MGIFDDMFHDVGAVVAGLVTAQPPSILAAVQLATRALLGDKHAGARIRAVSAKSPHAQSVASDPRYARLCPPPAAMSVTPVKPLTCTGNMLSVVVPFPS